MQGFHLDVTMRVYTSAVYGLFVSRTELEAWFDVRKMSILAWRNKHCASYVSEPEGGGGCGSEKQRSWEGQQNWGERGLIWHFRTLRALSRRERPSKSCYSKENKIKIDRGCQVDTVDIVLNDLPSPLLCQEWNPRFYCETACQTCPDPPPHPQPHLILHLLR